MRNDMTAAVQKAWHTWRLAAIYSAMDRETAKYVMRACNVLVPQIAEKAIELAQEDLKTLRLEAQEEAQSVLQQVT